MLLLLSPVVAFLIFTIESETNLKGVCDYGLMHVWAFVLVGLFIVDLVSMTTFWTNTAYTRNELAELMKPEVVLPESSTGSLKQRSKGYNSFPIPEDTLCLPIDHCVLYRQGAHAEQDLDCAETANCCYFGFIPFAKVGLLVWGHIMLNGGELVLLPTNNTGSRLDCFTMDTSSPLPPQFGTMSMFILIYGWVVWSCHLLLCCCPLTVRDVTTNENEFSRSRKRRKLHQRSNVGRQQNGGGNGVNDAPIIAPTVNATPHTNTMTRTAEDVQLNQAIQASLSDVPTANATPHTNTTTRTVDDAQLNQAIQASMSDVPTANATPHTNTTTRTVDDAQLNQAIQASMSDVETGNRNPYGNPLLEEKAEEKVEGKEEDGTIKYVAKGIGNASLYVGRGMFRIAAWGAKAGASVAFGTGQEEKDLAETEKKY